MINGLPMPDAVTVLVSTELLAQLEADWSPPVQIQIRRTPGIGSGYEMIARTHNCQPDYPYPVVCRRCSGYGVLPDSGAKDDDTPKLCPACTVQPDSGATNG